MQLIFPNTIERGIVLLIFLFSFSLPFSISIATGLIFLIVLSSLYLIIKNKHSYLIIPQSSVEWAVIIFLFWMIFSTFFGYKFSQSIPALRNYYTVLLLFILPRFVKSNDQVKFIVDSFILASVITAIFGTWQFFNLPNFAPKAYSTRSNPLTFAESLLFALALALPRIHGIFFLSSKNLINILVTLVLVTGLVAAGCRGPWLAFLFMVLILESIKRRGIPWVTLVFIGTLAISSINTKIDTGVQFRSIVDFKTNHSNNTRFEMWSVAINMIRERPVFGYGLRQVKEGYSEMAVKLGLENPQAWGEVHNVYFQEAVTHGLLGLCFFLGIFIVSFRALWKYSDDDLIQGVLIALVGFLVAGLTESIFNDSEIRMALFLFLGLGCSRINLIKSTPLRGLS